MKTESSSISKVILIMTLLASAFVCTSTLGISIVNNSAHSRDLHVDYFYYPTADTKGVVVPPPNEVPRRENIKANSRFAINNNALTPVGFELYIVIYHLNQPQDEAYKRVAQIYFNIKTGERVAAGLTGRIQISGTGVEPGTAVKENFYTCSWGRESDANVEIIYTD